MRSTLNFRQEIAAVPAAHAPTNMSQESGMRVGTATILSPPARSPNPASMSDPGQPDRPRRTADPATIQATIGIRVHANARTDSPNIDVAHDGDSDTPWYDQFERSLNGPAARRRELLNRQLVDRPADHRRQFAHQAIGHLPGHRDLALALKFLDRGLGLGAHRAGRLQLAVAILRERALHCSHAARARRWIG